MRHAFVAAAVALLAGVGALVFLAPGQTTVARQEAVTTLQTAPVAQTTEAPTTSARVTTTQAPVASTIPATTSQPVPATLPPLEGADACGASVGLDGIFIPRIGVCRQIKPKDLDLNGLNPLDGVVTRYLHSSLPGQGKVTFLTAHRDQPNGDHVFLWLEELAVGDDVMVWSEGRAFRYQIEADWGLIPKPQFGAWSRAYYDQITEHRLMIVTCGGEFDSSTGHYEDNVVYTAKLVS